MWWYRQIYTILLICLLFFIAVKGSCLEYGHSCWGAHGKRSGINSGKVYRTGSELRSGDLNGLPNNANNGALSNKQLFDDFNDELAAPAESAGNTGSAEESNSIANNGSKLKNLLRKRKSKFRNRNSLDDSSEPQERNENQRAERWHRLPVFNLKRFDKSAMSAGDLLGQLERQAASGRAAGMSVGVGDEGNYYDFN